MKIRRNKPIIIFLIVSGSLILLHFVGILRPIENFLLFLIKPSLPGLYRSASNVNQIYNDNKNSEDLNVKVEELSKEIARLSVFDSRCSEIAEENRKLRETLNFLDTNDFEAVAVGVISRETTIEDNSVLIINQGSRSGIYSGLGVVNEEGIIIGKVVEVKDSISKICLTNSPNCQLAASIQNQNKTQGITDGDLGLTIKMNYIPQLEEINIGDTVITSGLGDNIPRGLVIGKVMQIQNDSNDVWQSATIEPLANLNNLTVLSVIIP